MASLSIPHDHRFYTTPRDVTWFTTGTRTEMVSFDDLNMSWLDSSTAMIARPFLKIDFSPSR